MIDREASKDYTIPKTETSPEVCLKRGDSVWVLIAGLQNDPKYFPNPGKFNPERFNEKNKHNVEQCAYLPFGAGPRNCLGRYLYRTAKLLCVSNF